MKNIYSILLCSTFMLSGCGNNDEKEARTLLNQAIKKWDTGELEQADALFQQIENEYLATAVATDSIKERQKRHNKYRESINLDQVKQLNTGSFSKKIVQALTVYQQKNQQYPDTLSSLKIADDNLKPFIIGCDYKKALFNTGYSLNCLEADSEFDKQLRTKSDSKRRKQLEAERNKPKNLASFPKAQKTFGRLFNPTNTLPKSGFLAYYFRMSEPNKIVFREQVSDIAINYAWDEFHQIDSKEFGGYWVGQLNFDKSIVKNISVDLSWSSARVMIDKHIIYDGKNNSKNIPITFPAGNHLIEVEYSNGWHTTEFAVSFSDNKNLLSEGDIKKYFRENKNILGDFDVFYAGAYESANKNLTVPLNILPNKKPIVLVLSSYSVIKWIVNNPHNVEIKAIIVGSYNKGTEVRGINESIKLLYTQGQFGGYQLSAECECQPNGDFYCKYATGTSKSIERLTGHKLNGFSGQYASEGFDIPDKIINDALRDTLELENEKIKKQRQACTKKYNPNFENILQEYQ